MGERLTLIDKRTMISRDFAVSPIVQDTPDNLQIQEAWRAWGGLLEEEINGLRWCIYVKCTHASTMRRTNMAFYLLNCWLGIREVTRCRFTRA